jgi:hypothetical protein
VNRLRDAADHEGGLREDPLFREGIELLQRTPPTSAPAELKLRVWHAIRRTHASATARRRLGGLVLKLAVVGAVALAAGTAGAVITQRWIVPRLDRATEPVAPHARAPRRIPAPRREKAEAASPESVVEAAAESPPLKVAVRPAPRKIASATPTAASVARERSEVLDALIALRREHDPARAGTLLSRYLSAHPHGALREEALALAIEAADARGDRAAGAALARAYQEEFPAGRFSAFAGSHTDRGGAREKNPAH